MRVDEVFSWLEEKRRNKGMSLGLDRMRKLLHTLQDPQDYFRIIRIAGTNGKGSTAAALSQILSQSGIRTGRYTSPAVFSPYEQYTVCGEWVSPECFAEGMTRVKEAAEAMAASGEEEPTAFELETAFAFWLFAREKCELAVVECGLGGDMDATNAAGETACSVITPISLDHTAILGKRLRDIALHKAGIMRAGVPVISAEQPDEAAEVLEKEADEMHSPLTVVKNDDVRVVYTNRQGMVVYYKDLEQLKIPQRGLFFAQSAALAIEAARSLHDSRVTEESIRRGLEKIAWPGRFELIGTAPDIVLDGAHNPGGARRLKESLNRYYGGQQLTFVMGVLQDKDYREMISILLGRAARVFVVTPESGRALPKEKLGKAIRERYSQLAVKEKDSVTEAIEAAVKAGDPVVVCGTLTIAGEAREGGWSHGQ